jgi:hypothetical protein
MKAATHAKDLPVLRHGLGGAWLKKAGLSICLRFGSLLARTPVARLLVSTPVARYMYMLQHTVDAIRRLDAIRFRATSLHSPKALSMPKADCCTAELFCCLGCL